MRAAAPVVSLLALALSVGACGAVRPPADVPITAAGPGAAPPPPRPDPIDLELPRLDGGTFRLSDERGRVVVLHFFASFDGPSQSVATALEQISVTHRDRGVTVIGVAMDPELGHGGRQAMVESYCAVSNVTFEVALASDALFEGRTDVGRIPAIPATVVLDRRGRPVASVAGTFRRSELERLLAPLVREEPPAE